MNLSRVFARTRISRNFRNLSYVSTIFFGVCTTTSTKMHTSERERERVGESKRFDTQTWSINIRFRPCVIERFLRRAYHDGWACKIARPPPPLLPPTTGPFLKGIRYRRQTACIAMTFDRVSNTRVHKKTSAFFVTFPEWIDGLLEFEYSSRDTPIDILK